MPPVIEIRCDARGRWSVRSEDGPPTLHDSETDAERDAFARAAEHDDARVVLFDRYMRSRVLTRERPAVAR